MTRFTTAVLALLLTTPFVTAQTLDSPVRLMSTGMADARREDPNREMTAALDRLTEKIALLVELQTNASPVYSMSDACGYQRQFAVPSQHSFNIPGRSFSMPSHTPGLTLGNRTPVIDTNNTSTRHVPRVVHIDGSPVLILEPEPVPLLRRFCGRLDFWNRD